MAPDTSVEITLVFQFMLMPTSLYGLNTIDPPPVPVWVVVDVDVDEVEEPVEVLDVPVPVPPVPEVEPVDVAPPVPEVVPVPVAPVPHPGPVSFCELYSRRARRASGWRWRRRR